MMEMSGVRGVIVPCAGWLMSRWPMVTGQCVIVEGLHLPFSTNFNNSLRPLKAWKVVKERRDCHEDLISHGFLKVTEISISGFDV